MIMRRLSTVQAIYSMRKKQERLVALLTVFIFCGLCFVPHHAWAVPKLIPMYIGEVKVLKLEKIDRVAIGDPKVVSNSILPNGQLVLLADNRGITTLHIWLSSGEELQFDVVVKQRKTYDSFSKLSKLLDHMPGVSVTKLDDMLVVEGKTTKAEQQQLLKILDKYEALNLATVHEDEGIIRELLQNVPNVTIKEIDDYTVVFGEVNEDYSKLIKRVADTYSGLLDMTRVQKSVVDDDAIRSFLQNVPNITIKDIDDYTAVFGEVNQDYSNLIQRVAEIYPRLLDMTRVQKNVVEKMVHMHVRVMEIKKSVHDQLGINWSTLGIVGPSAAWGVEVSRNGGTILNADNTSDALKKPETANLNSARGYFGIATGISSIINLSEQNGDAVVLAEPQLSTRSGGKATFLAGGEYPMPVTSSLGQTTVEFKPYGIKLDIEPVVDGMGNVLATVETEISTIDKNIVLYRIPGLSSRKTSTEVNLRPEQTLVIAGLVLNTVSKSFDNVKWLGDIPILGPLFRSKDFQNDRTELVIFITPHVRDIGSPVADSAKDRAASIQADFDELSKGSKILD